MRIVLLIVSVGVILLAWFGFHTYLRPADPESAYESVRVIVFADHYEINGHRFEGKLSEQLNHYADGVHKVSISLSGDPKVVSERVAELSDLVRKPNVRLAWLSPPERP